MGSDFDEPGTVGKQRVPAFYWCPFRQTRSPSERKPSEHRLFLKHFFKVIRAFGYGIRLFVRVMGYFVRVLGYFVRVFLGYYLVYWGIPFAKKKTLP